ncbi:MAG: ComEC/Rec2 family competence protein [Clostridia bacterium]|nr:ComEC/Rec2 family competence protein [Clostridia bacterium]MBQ9998052.1 ComEC/Rec2 family competence protein [Clostridia bacterium]
MKNPLLVASVSFMVAAFCVIMFSINVSLLILTSLSVILSVIMIYGIIKRNKEFIVSCIFCIVFLVTGGIYCGIHLSYCNTMAETGKIEVEGKIVDDNIVQAKRINGKKVLTKMRFYYSYYGDEYYEAGDRVTVKGELKHYALPAYYGDLNYNNYAKAKYIYGYITDCEITKTGHFADLYKIGYKMREAIINKIDLYYKNDEAGLLKALLIGDKTGISPELSVSLAYSGLSHIAVVSGSHISIIISLVGFWFSFLKKYSKIYVPLILIFMGLLLCLIGGQPSVIRAVIMAVYSLFVLTLLKRYDMMTALMFSGAVLIVINPYFAVDAGFLLSFFATFALVAGLKEKFTYYSLALLFITLMPLCFYYFNYVSFAMFFTSVIITPIVTLLLPLGFLSCLLPLVSILAKPLLKLTILISDAFAFFDIFRVNTVVPSVYVIIALCLVLCATYFAVLRYKKITLFAIIFAIMFFVADISLTNYDGNTVTVFEKGGAVMHVSTYNGKNIIICTDDFESCRNYIKRNNIKTVDLLYFTKFQKVLTADDNIEISKVCMPKVAGEKCEGDYAFKYYLKENTVIDEVVITPVSYMPYKTKVDHKKAVTTVNFGNKVFLVAPYKDNDLNIESLQDIKADVVVCDNKTQPDSLFIQNCGARFVTGDCLQQSDNMLYLNYNTDICGSVTFTFDNGNISARTLR